MARVRIILLVIAGLCVSGSLVQSTSPSLYYCPDGRVIRESWLCDGVNDCGDEDATDEQNCGGSADVTCSDAFEFRCKDGTKCISLLWMCDGDNDCADGSDERGSCGSRDCLSAEFQCDNGRCVWASFVCDGDNDCRDMSDEINCTKPGGCAEHQYQCDNKLCIPDNWRCDGEPDCDDDSDEMECGNIVYECGFGMFNCTSGGCINVNLVCDGVSDCPQDDSDEEDCPSRICRDTQFQCPDEAVGCIPKEWVCDGEDDCGDWTDEIDCEGLCLMNQFACITSGCVEQAQHCDGTEDCLDGSDEFLCPLPPPPITCREGQFRCWDGLRCIDPEFLCDNHPSCADGSDENPKQCATATPGVNECLTDNGGCGGICYDTVYSHFCTCDHGYYLDADDRKSCFDVNECETPGQCSQVCRNLNGSYECSCVDGYEKTSVGDHGGCKAKGDPAFLLFANRVDIRRVNLDGSHSQLLIRQLHNSIAVDFHYELGYIFWTDLTVDSIRRANMDGQEITTIIDNGLDGPGGLAVDWVGNKLYWTDAETSRIEVSDLDGKNRTVLFSSGLDRPRAIVVNPSAGLLFWTDWGANPKIERASMDGSGRTLLHDKRLFWPNALTIDYPTESLYWGDAKLHVIETCLFDGSNRRMVLLGSDSVHHPFAITVFEDMLYWTDWDTKAILSTQKGVGKNVTELYGNLFHPMDLHVVHSVRQPAATNPCQEENGGCKYLCLLGEGNNGYSCSCPTGIRLAEDGRDCLNLDTFILFAHRTDIRRVSLDVDQLVDVTLPLVNLSGATAVDWDSKRDRIYWTDVLANTINVANIDGSDQQVLIDNNLGSPSGLAIDWVTEKLYWTDSETDRIEVSNLDGSQRKIIIYGELDKPRDIVVYPALGIMFWTDWGVRPKIERSSLDGSQRRAIVTTNLTFPNGLALDYEHNRIYWADAGFGVIEYADFDGSNRHIFLSTGLPHPFGLALHDEYIYWTDWNTRTIQRANKTDAQVTSTVVSNLDTPMDIHVFHRIRDESVDNPCTLDNGGCSHLCLTRPGRHGLDASCACPTGHLLQEDRQTCNSDINAYLIFPTGKDIRQISLDVSYLADIILPAQITATTSIDVDLVTKDVYWTNDLETKIYKAPMGGGPPVEVITSRLVAPRSIAVDWIGRNLYWVDAGTRRIEVAHLDGSSRRVLFSSNLISPNGIVVDLQSHSMFWTDLGDSIHHLSPKIEKAAMDGSGRRTIISTNLGMPKAITVDNPAGIGGRIYWTDSFYGTIDWATLNGGERGRILADLSSPYGLTVHGDFIYWTDWTLNTVNKAQKRDGSSQRVVSDGLGGPLAEIRLIKTTDLADKDTFDHPCDEDKGCSDLCLPNHSIHKYTCSCPTGINVQPDQMTCPPFPDVYLLFAARSTIRRISLDVTQPHDYNDVILVSNLLNAVSIDYLLSSREEGLVFWSDESLGSIFVANLNGTDKRTIVSSLRIVDGIAVDWMAGNIYWTDAGHDHIMVARIDGSDRKTIISTGLDEPRGLVVHPHFGLLFWTDWSPSRPKIERSNLDGSGRMTLVSSSITWPNGITLDYSELRVYWVDAYEDKLESVNINGNDRRMIIDNTQRNLVHPFGVTVFSGFVFWSDWDNQSIFRANLDEQHGGINQRRIGEPLSLPMGITIVSDTRPGELTPFEQPGPCSLDNGGCSSMHLCLAVNLTHRRCGCPDRLKNSASCHETVGLPLKGTPLVTDPPSDTDPTTIMTEVMEETTKPGGTPTKEPPGTGTVPTTEKPSTDVSKPGQVESTTASISDDSNEDLLIAVVVVCAVVLLVLIGIAFVAIFFLKRQHDQQERERSVQRLAVASRPHSPHTLNKLNSQQPRQPVKSMPKSIKNTNINVDLDNKRNSQTVNESNTFVEEPEVFEIPIPMRRRRMPSIPESPPLKLPTEEDDNSPPPPRPPKHEVYKRPPKKPPAKDPHSEEEEKKEQDSSPSTGEEKADLVSELKSPTPARTNLDSTTDESTV